MADAAGLLPAPHHSQTATGAQGLVKVFAQVDAVDRQQIEAVHSQPAEAGLKLRLEGAGVLVGGHLALQDATWVVALIEKPAQLPLRGAVVAGGLDVVQTA